VSRRCLSCDRSFRPEFATMRLCWPCWRELQAQAKKPRTVAVSPVEADLLKSAIALCHPDRHPPERARIANAVTAALLELLAAARRAAA
jgi:hypothetical protein